MTTTIKTQITPTELKWRFIGFAGKMLLTILFSTLRIETRGLEKSRRVFFNRHVIFAFWHARLLGASWCFDGYDGVAMVSASNDGEIIARILERQGHTAVRGSTTRGGVRAMTQLIRLVKERKCHACIIPDGPQGPRHKVQPGIVRLARKTGMPLIPFTYSAEHMKVFNSWDRFILPYPFSKAVFMFGDPIWAPSVMSKEEEKNLTLKLEKEMDELTRKADRYYGRVIT